MDRVKGKTAIVTGGASGIGHAACVLLAQEGAAVAVTDVVDDQGKRTACKIRDAGGVADYWQLDVSSEADVKKVFAEIQARFGRIDVLVKNAGIGGPNKPTHEITEEEWDRLIGVDLKGVFLCTKHVIPYLKANGGGSVINLSSIYGLVGGADAPPYHAAKGAVRLMAKNDALLYASDRIRVYSIHPGFIWTPLVERTAAEMPGGSAAFRKQLDSKHPIGHIGEPDDVGWGIVYLASDEAKFVTGSELVIDGGYTAQ